MNRHSTLIERKLAREMRRSNPWWAAPAAFLATLLALPVHAGVVIPDEPLTTGNRVAPNILFILDDSGSMSRVFMPRDVDNDPSGSVADNAHVHNTLIYNPEVNYLPWMRADGTRMTAGTSIYSVLTSNDNASGTPINLMNAADCQYAVRNGSSRAVCGSLENRTFYILKTGQTANSSRPERYYRYQIITISGAPTFVRAEYGNSSVGGWNATYGCSGSGSGNGWRNCTIALPNTRSLADELKNYATWFSYHRTRMKSAKAGASEAFAPMGNRVRVGFRTIWQRGANHANPIPVTIGDGRFIDDATKGIANKSNWYTAMQSVTGGGNTPLHGALYQAGEYFSSDNANGAYGPQVKAEQFSCRQNFAILTTDGYWNNYSYSTNIGEQDNASGSLITGPGGKSYTYLPKAPYKSGDAYTLADVAMYYWKRDLRTDLTNNVPTSTSSDAHPKDGDPAFWQHMTTFGISIGLSGTSGWGSVNDVLAGATWPNPNDAQDADRIDDLLHAAVNGHGAFVAATNPSEFTMGLKRALAAIAKRTSSFSNVATNSTSLNTGAQVFSASYVAGDWLGALKAQAVSKTGVSATITWEASIPAVGSRKIFTATGTPGQAGVSGATFPTSAQQAKFPRTGGVVNYAVSAADNAAYLKGSAVHEERNGVSNLRDRPTSVLGDIVGSSPAYVKDTNTLYVGANDGMMHAFNAATGQELFAYVPNLIDFDNLSTLSRGDYTHKFFVDGPISVSPRSLTPAKNILVGTLGRGGKGLYALDVSSPASFGTGSFKWERKDTSGNNMGMVLGTPILANVRDGSATPAVVIGNGPNSSSDKAVLIVMNLETGAVIREIDTGAGGTGSPNGLFSPLGLYGADGKTLVYVYAGDMLGNVWKFDLRSTSRGSWTAKKIFTAKTGQAITSGLTFAVDPKTNKRWVFFGTGRFLTTTDADDKTPYAQSMYGVIDDDAGSAYTRANLTSRSITVSGDYRYFQAKSALASTSKGWYVDLPGKGERIVQDALIDGDYAVMASMIPEGDACDASGTGYINAIDAFTGTSGGKSYFDLGKDGTTDDTGAGGNPIGSVNLGVGMPTRPVLLPGIGVGSGSAGTTGEFGKTPMSWNRVSWREIRND